MFLIYSFLPSCAKITLNYTKNKTAKSVIVLPGWINPIFEDQFAFSVKIAQV